MNTLVKSLIVFLIQIFVITSLEVIPERAALIYINPKYVSGVEISVRRYSRKSPYVLNLKGTTLHTWANNVSIHFIFHEYLHNEFRRSFIEMNFKACEIVKDPIFSPVFKKLNISCPLPAGFYNLANMSLVSVPAVDNLPYKWPFEKGMVKAIVKTHPGKEIIGEGDLVATFKQEIVYKKKGS